MSRTLLFSLLSLTACASTPATPPVAAVVLDDTSDALMQQRLIAYGTQPAIDRQQDRVQEAHERWDSALQVWTTARSQGQPQALDWAQEDLEDAAEAVMWHELELELAELRRALELARLQELEHREQMEQLTRSDTALTKRARRRAEAQLVRDEQAVKVAAYAVARVDALQAAARERLDAMERDGISKADAVSLLDEVENAEEFEVRIDG